MFWSPVCSASKGLVGCFEVLSALLQKVNVLWEMVSCFFFCCLVPESFFIMAKQLMTEQVMRLTSLQVMRLTSLQLMSLARRRLTQILWMRQSGRRMSSRWMMMLHLRRIGPRGGGNTQSCLSLILVFLNGCLISLFMILLSKLVSIFGKHCFFRGFFLDNDNKIVAFLHHKPNELSKILDVCLLLCQKTSLYRMWVWSSNPPPLLAHQPLWMAAGTPCLALQPSPNKHPQSLWELMAI